MEKAILKTLVYADLFDYPLKAWEIHKWLISKQGNLREVEKALKNKTLELRVKNHRGYYFLSKREGLVRKRLIREKQSKVYLQQAQLISWFFKIIPWVKLVGVSGSLAMENASKNDDIDLFVVTSKNRLWISRILMLGILELVGKRRKKTDSRKKASRKICINILLDMDRLGQSNNNIYLAHEVLQMRVLWQREGMYHQFLSENEWVFKYLPNWTSGGSIKDQVSSIKGKQKERSLNSSPLIFNALLNKAEDLAKRFQLNYMGTPKGKERVEEGALYFHPNDLGPQILKKFAQRCKKYKLS